MKLDKKILHFEAYMELTDEQLQEIANLVEKKLTIAREGHIFRAIPSSYGKPLATATVPRNSISELKLETEIIDEENTD